MLQEGTESNGRILGGTRFTSKSKDRKKRKDTDEEYRSTSTIDNPPKDEGEESQGKLWSSENIEEMFNAENQPMDRMFAVELTLKLKPKNGKAVTIPVLNEEIRASIVPEALALSMDARRYKSVLKAVLDVPDKE